MLIASYTQAVFLRRVTLPSQWLLVFAIVIGSNAPLEFFITHKPALVPLNSLAWFALYLAAAGGLILSHGINWISWLIRYRLLLVLLLTGALLLTPWSVEPVLSLNRLTHLFGTTLIAVYIGFSIPMDRTLRIFAGMLFVLLASGIVVSQLFPLYAWEQHGDALALKGIMDNKNTLGFWAGISLLLFPWMARQHNDLPTQFFWGCATFLSLIILLQSRSAGSVIAIAVAISAMAYFALSYKLKLGFLAMAVVGSLLSILLLLLFSELNIAQLTGRSNDLTGRAEVWSQTWTLIQQRPLTGYGYGTLWFPTEATRWIQERYTDFTWMVYHAHNGGLQVASELGLPLTALALLFVVQQLVEVVFWQIRQKQIGTLFSLGFILAFLVSNYSEARFLQSRELFWLFFIALPICMVREVDVRPLRNRKFVPPKLAANSDQVRYPDEYIPNPETKLGRLRAVKKTRRLRRDAMNRLAAPKP